MTKRVNKSADLTIINLHRNPLMLAALRHADVLLVDEIGDQAAEIWSIIDIVFRNVRQSNSYLGGVLKISTMDPSQLPSFNGKPFLLSSFILTSYKICKLSHSVRAFNDPMLQRLNQLARQMEYNNEELDEFEEIIQNSCKHVNDWNSNEITPFMI